jgi:hypothetical protein
MLETIVIVAAVFIGLVILGLLFYAARQADSTLQRRIDSAEAGGRPLSLDERSAMKVRRLRPTPPRQDK